MLQNHNVVQRCINVVCLLGAYLLKAPIDTIVKIAVGTMALIQYVYHEFTQYYIHLLMSIA